MSDHKVENIRRPILEPVAISIAILLATSLFLLVWFQNKNIRNHVENHILSTSQLFSSTMREEAKLIRAIMGFYATNKELAAAFKAKDRELLFQKAKPIFDALKSEHQITHFYFIEKDKRAFLRMYNPEKYGDVINRYKLDKAVMSGEVQSGLSLGSSGTLTLRVDMPWVMNNELLGYIEMGKEVDYITPILKKTLDVELLLLVEKNAISRERWEEGQKVMGHRKASWDELPDHVVIGNTMGEAPKDLNDYLVLPHEVKRKEHFKTRVGPLHLRGGFSPLIVASGEEIGEILTLKDFTGPEHALKMFSGLMVSLFIVLSCFLFVFIYGVINKVELRLKKSRKDLNIEIVERTKAEGRLLALLDEKEILLKEIHHRVKNNLQIVYSLFRLQLRQIEDPKAVEILTDSQSRISAMSLVHKTLYQPKKQSSIYLKEYIQELTASIFESYSVNPELITLKTAMEPISMDFDIVMPIGLIINELVANCIKYAFPNNRAGEIEIVLAKKNDGDYLIRVADNGIGLPDNFDPREVSSLGLQLVINLTENQLMGKIEVDGSHGGTRVTITFGEPPKKSTV
ncbi:MAG: hypothetical protein KKG47_15845 [Proteobacteria bacterium]|nr:hypothetical protein [Pseudomonadota bacterium]MBU1737778.1 hypothetical protein [Pseudomonadota bacterium]